MGKPPASVQMHRRASVTQNSVQWLTTWRAGMISSAPTTGAKKIRGSTLWIKIPRHDLGI
jgi:hypothetical protein